MSVIIVHNEIYNLKDALDDLDNNFHVHTTKENLAKVIKSAGSLSGIIPMSIYLSDEEKNYFTDLITSANKSTSTKGWFGIYKVDEEELVKVRTLGGLALGIANRYWMQLEDEEEKLKADKNLEIPNHERTLPFPTPTSDLHESVNNIYQALGQNSPGYDIGSEFEMLVTELSEKRFYDQLVREGHVIQDKIFADENKDLEQPLNEEEKKVLRTYTKRVATRIRAHDKQTEIDLEVQRELE